MIERRNIIRLLGGRANVYHSALLTSYNFDPIFFESVYLSTLRQLGITNIVVLIESTMYDQLLADSNYQYHWISQNNYTLVRQENNHFGVFHPKMTLLFGEEEGALIVGSGNLTFSGLSNNEEIWNVFHVLGNESIHYPLFHKAWDYLIEITRNGSPLVLRQIEWMSEQTPWLNDDSTKESVILTSGEECTFLYNTPKSTILDSLYSHVGEKLIDKITIIAPFYDTEGNALKSLQNHFSPRNMICVLDLMRQSAPYVLLHDTNIAFNKITTTSPLHAKLVELQGENETWLLCGSANAGNMALGTSKEAFNDEACILLHNYKKKNYVRDLGLNYTLLTPDEKRSIVYPKQDNSRGRTSLVTFISCEEKEHQLYLRFKKRGVKGTFTVLDHSQNNVFTKNVVTDYEIVIDYEDVDVGHLDIAVLKEDDFEISNRVLIIKEICVECGNPDPKRRKLSSLLDDAGMLENLSHILGYIEFEDVDKKTRTIKMTQKSGINDKEDDNTVTRDRFDKLKDSSLNINMHSGLRILSYLKQILFKNTDNEQTDEELLGLDEEGINGNDNNKKGNTMTKPSAIDEAARTELDVVNFLNKMLLFLRGKTQDKNLYGNTDIAVNKPKLVAIPDLNAASSIDVASNAVLYLMNKYESYVTDKNRIRDLLLKCAGIFFSLYANSYPQEDSLRNRKTREILKDATVNLLSALSFFEFSRTDALLPQLILNCLDPWRGQCEQSEIIPLYEKQLEKLDPKHVNKRTSDKIQKIAKVYLSDNIPIVPLSTNYDSILMYCSGYGFLIVDNIKYTGKGFSYNYHSPWFDTKIDNITATKYKGYANSWG